MEKVNAGLLDADAEIYTSFDGSWDARMHPSLAHEVIVAFFCSLMNALGECIPQQLVQSRFIFMRTDDACEWTGPDLKKTKMASSSSGLLAKLVGKIKNANEDIAIGIEGVIAWTTT
ncbi:hypothetical protein O6H91_Y400200 [Diphasiastrum complanatum]|nr:hypothetical protein O6H91_Y400200 [Diphasiastrum complanatum]